MDEETVVKFYLIGSIFLGDGSIPQNPTAGGNSFPQTPAMILTRAELSMGVDLIGYGEIALKDIETGKKTHYYLRDSKWPIR